MYERISTYVVAHQDDWQLFMDPNISADIVDPKCKTIIIHTTAGDAGKGKKYWLAREWGALDSLLFRVSYTENVQLVEKKAVINDMKIKQVNIGHCSIYFLRLPDGGMYGDGFERYKYQSMAKIRLNVISKITTVDSQNTFLGFGEISCLINEMIRNEQQLHDIRDAGRTTLNFPEFDGSLSPDDHNDHLNTALLISGMEIYPSVRKQAFVHYDIQNSAKDLNGMDLFWKVGMFSVYHQTVLKRHGHSTIGEAPFYSAWCRKNALFRELV